MIRVIRTETDTGFALLLGKPLIFEGKADPQLFHRFRIQLDRLVLVLITNL